MGASLFRETTFCSGGIDWRACAGTGCAILATVLRAPAPTLKVCCQPEVLAVAQGLSWLVSMLCVVCFSVLVCFCCCWNDKDEYYDTDLL